MNFSHISPINHLNRIADRPFHLTLAHLIEQSDDYTNFYVEEKKKNPSMVNIMDNSGFEMYKQNRDFLNPNQLIDLGKKINADYLVMTDYPGQDSDKTIEAAEYLMPKIKNAGFGTFFCPQSEIGDLDDLIEAFAYAATNPNIDYIGVSILAVPNAFGVERDNKLQRYMSRYSFCNIIDTYEIDGLGYWDYVKQAGKKIHFLGMVDGPNEIELIANSAGHVDTWDSSAAIWAGLNNIAFDFSPTGLINGKFEKEVDFHSNLPWNEVVDYNISHIDDLSEWLF